MPPLDDPGSFYLGRLHDLASGETSAEPVLYDSRDLTTHAVCVGMTGSGKTGLCVSLIEEAALDGVPVLAIDPKGDLGNLLLTFPEMRGEDFRPWIDPAAAQRKGQTPEEFAEATAELWRNGLAQWGQDQKRISRFEQSVDRAIYTPGSTAGLPLTVLRSFAAPPAEVIADNDAFVDRVQDAASGVLALLGIDADPVRSREHILLSNVLRHHWLAGRDLDLAGLIGQIQSPPMERVGALEVETFYPAEARQKLAMQLNNLLASPSFQSWLEGEPLDINRLLYTAEGKPRVSILSIAHLSDSERMFFVTLLLSELVSWMRTQPGTTGLRAILYMDEVFGYFPPTANPPSKRPMLTLMKQARAFGVGCVLATQNPVDLDYKGLSNAGTWLLGRLQTERDKMRVLEGLEGASAQAGSSFDRGRMEATLAALGGRVFLMNNVHSDRPAVFHTRWAMSYLRGPLTREQIRLLMAARKGETPQPEPPPRAARCRRGADADRVAGGRRAVLLPAGRGRRGPAAPAGALGASNPEVLPREIRARPRASLMGRRPRAFADGPGRMGKGGSTARATFVCGNQAGGRPTGRAAPRADRERTVRHVGGSTGRSPLRHPGVRAAAQPGAGRLLRPGRRPGSVCGPARRSARNPPCRGAQGTGGALPSAGRRGRRAGPQGGAAPVDAEVAVLEPVGRGVLLNP